MRRVWNEADQKWYFAIQDVLEILTGSSDVKQYVKKLKSRDPELNSNWGTLCTLVEMTAADGKLTAEISKATFGMTPSEYRDFKALNHTGDNLRDHMTDLEKKSGRKVSTRNNYKELPEGRIRLSGQNRADADVSSGT